MHIAPLTRDEFWLIMQALSEMAIKNPTQAALIIELLGKLNESVDVKGSTLAIIKTR